MAYIPETEEVKEQFSQEDNLIARDIKIADNERARRRRQRTADRRRTTNQRRRPTNNGPRNGNMASKKFSLNDIVGASLHGFAESVVHPFGNGAVGAVCPDRYSELVIPCTDRLDFDLSPAAAWTTGDSTDLPVEWVLAGWNVWFMPRCISAGWLSEVAGDYQYAFQSYDSFDGVEDDSVPLDLYTLCYIPYWLHVGKPKAGFLEVTAGMPPTVEMLQGYKQVRYARFAAIQNNCDKARVLGAGIKLWSEESPINTGGYCYGGWCTMNDIFATVYSPLQGSEIISLPDHLRYINREIGLKGTTTRYSVLQTPEQLEPEYPSVPARIFTVSSGVISVVGNNDLGTNDVTTPGSYVPMSIWRFNVTDNVEGGTASAYTLKLSSMVHIEGYPNGDSPFQSARVLPDPMFDHIQYFLENPEQFPAAVGGHSFKSFTKKAAHIVGKATKFAGHFQKLMKLLDGVAQDT